jgi:hypothetical protein
MKDSKMPEIPEIPKTLMLIGALLFLTGLVWYFISPYINVGKLPGDIVIEKENFKFYFPVVSSLILSILISALIWVFKKSQ